MKESQGQVPYFTNHSMLDKLAQSPKARKLRALKQCKNAKLNNTREQKSPRYDIC